MTTPIPQTETRWLSIGDSHQRALLRIFHVTPIRRVLSSKVWLESREGFLLVEFTLLIRLHILLAVRSKAKPTL